MLERGSSRKSLETRGSFSKPRIPFIGPSAAAFMAAFTSSIVVGFRFQW